MALTRETHFSGFAYVTVHVKPLTLDDHNFFVRIPIQVFLDSTESPLCLEFVHMPMNGIWAPHIF